MSEIDDLKAQIAALTARLEAMQAPAPASQPPVVRTNPSQVGDPPRRPACRRCGSYLCGGCAPSDLPPPPSGPQVVPPVRSAPARYVGLGGGRARVTEPDGQTYIVGPGGRVVEE